MTGSRTASPNKEAASRKRAFEESGPSNAFNKRMSPAQAVAPMEAAILKKLRTSNDVRTEQLHAVFLQQNFDISGVAGHLCATLPARDEVWL